MERSITNTHFETYDVPCSFSHKQVIWGVGNYLKALISILIGGFSKSSSEDYDLPSTEIQVSQKLNGIVNVILGGPAAGGSSHA